MEQDVIPKPEGSAERIATPPEEDRAMATVYVKYAQMFAIF